MLVLLAMACSATAATRDVPPDIAPADEVFYQIFVRSFQDSNGDRRGDLRGIVAKLDYLQQLGVTSLLLTPLQPSPYYHNYFATEFKAIDPAYGTLADYTAFIRAAHKHGLKVYLDQEFQYVAEGHPWWRDALGKPDSPLAHRLLWRDAAHTVPEPFLDRPKWAGYDGRDYGIAMVDLNRPEVRQYFQQLMLFWIDPHNDGSGSDGADGLRIDHMMDDLDHKGLDRNLFAAFWSPMFEALKQRRPSLRILAEQADWGYGADWLTRGHADMVFAFPLRGALVQLDKLTIVKALRETAAVTPAGKDQVIFLENHDVDRYMSTVGDDMARARAGAAIELTLKGEPLIYYGQELGMRGRALKDIPISDGIQIPSREAFRWKADLDAAGSATWYRGDRPWWTQRYSRSYDGTSLEEEQAKPDSLYNWYRKLLALRHTRSELRVGQQTLPCDDASPVLCILREHGARRSLLLVNLGRTAARPSLTPDLADGKWTDLLEAHSDGTPDMPLQPLEVRMLGTP
ncbi:MAG TPA: alpha-amylase family glycosyl hydrolase [Dyella sp.]|uniref:alpha-amylase family glycosyl hydrolase n=1 Tax=Dyella sp. TaxID=1869338 RepID=UPI002F947375